MNRTLFKTGATISAICLCGLLMTGCMKTSPDPVLPGSGSTSASSSVPIESSSQPELAAVITDVNLSDAEIYEALAPQTFTEGEVADNPFYKRAVDENGVAVYVVKRASDNEDVNLPFSETTVYHRTDDDGPSYYERKVLTYKLDGVEKTQTAYELWVSDVLPGEVVASATDASSGAGAMSAGDVQVEMAVEGGTATTPVAAGN